MADEVKRKPQALAKGGSLPQAAGGGGGKGRAEKRGRKDTKSDAKQKAKTGKRKFTLTTKSSKPAATTTHTLEAPPRSSSSSKESPSIQKSLTLAGAQSRPSRPLQRRTTHTEANRLKPRRRPPPPPSTATATAGAGSTARPAPAAAADQVDGDIASTAPARPPSSEVTVPASLTAAGEPRRPAAPVQMRPRVQRVKRPVTRFIPPPPNIPLPPPPPRRRTSKQTASAAPPVSTSPPGNSAAASQPGNAAAKPPVLPKPAHLKRSVSELSRSPVATNPAPSDGGPVSSGEVSAKRASRPPPPVRSSSLSDKIGRPVRGQHQPSSPLLAIADTLEADAPKLGEGTAMTKRDSWLRDRSQPPTHSPPQRPAGEESRGMAGLGETAAESSEQRASEDSPRHQGEAEELAGGGSLRRKGNSLVRSLKRMVSSGKRVSVPDEKELAREQLTTDAEGNPPKESPKDIEGRGATISPPSSGAKITDDSPVPKPRTKLPRQVSVEAPAPTEVATNTGATTSSTSTAKAVAVPRPRPSPSTVASDSPKSPMAIAEPAKEKPVPLPRSISSSSATDQDRQPSAETDKGDVLDIRLEASSTTKQDSTNFYRAIQNYKAERETELSFSAGDILIEIDRPAGEEGFFYGMLDIGTTGLFPVSCVKLFDPSTQ